MKPIRTLTIAPSLPPSLERLQDLAYNLWWAWHMDAIDLFRRLDRDLWETSGHNPVLMLGTISQDILERASQDEAFLAHMGRVLDQLDRYMDSKSTWFHRSHGMDTAPAEPTVAYFSAEFGLTDCIRNYSGGLGILAGDHLKSASDLGLPLVGVGLLYQQGYFQQYLSTDGWQQETYPLNDFWTMPIRQVLNDEGYPLTIELDYPGQRVKAQIWRVQVGRIPLYLLDSNLDSNPPQYRDITDRLYGGGPELRIQQEYLMGIGGIRALGAMGITPNVYHVNEGHSAFLSLERTRLLMAEGNMPFEEARQAVRAGSIFTTHTPVPAGIDMFPPPLMDKYFGSYYSSLGLSREAFLSLGRSNPSDPNEPFSMAVLALRMSAYTNGVSKLHGGVARRMWSGLWPGVPEDDIPIDHVTNGIHIQSWISQDMAILFDRYLGPGWRDDPVDETVWQRVDQIPDEELWRIRDQRRARLISFARRRLREQLEQRGAPPMEIERAKGALDPNALTIGFARRFATYKRAALLMRDQGRLAKLLNDPDRPVQIIFAGKAHPEDQPGKELIKEVVRTARKEEFRRKIVFIEDYDMNAARYMLQGVDIWLNTPRRFREASGTSGMKAVVNGALNLSIPDGWWDEAYRPDVGWAIGRGEVYEDHNYQDELESRAVYDLLEKDVVPLFFGRNDNGFSRRWTAKVRAAMKDLSPYFNTHRMVREYAQRFYMPAALHSQRLAQSSYERARSLVAWEVKVRSSWPNLRILDLETDHPEEVQVGESLGVRALIQLGGLDPQDVKVDLYHGPLDERGEISPGETSTMLCQSETESEPCWFEGRIPFSRSGRYGYTLRMLPSHTDLQDPYELGLIHWANL